MDYIWSEIKHYKVMPTHYHATRLGEYKELPFFLVVSGRDTPSFGDNKKVSIGQLDPGPRWTRQGSFSLTSGMQLGFIPPTKASPNRVIIDGPWTTMIN